MESDFKGGLEDAFKSIKEMAKVTEFNENDVIDILLAKQDEFFTLFKNI